jgi:hypothetical protein
MASPPFPAAYDTKLGSLIFIDSVSSLQLHIAQFVPGHFGQGYTTGP